MNSGRRSILGDLLRRALPLVLDALAQPALVAQDYLSLTRL